MEKADITFCFGCTNGADMSPTSTGADDRRFIVVPQVWALPKGRPLHTEWPETAKPNFACQNPGQLNIS